MANFKGVVAPYAELPSKDRNRKASVDFSCGERGGKGASWKGQVSPAGATKAERSAIIKPSNIHDVKSDRKQNVGKAPKG